MSGPTSADTDAVMEMNNLPVMNRLHGLSHASDEEQGINVLQPADPSQIATDDLLNYCNKNKNLLLFLRITGNYWTQGEVVFTLDRFWCACCVIINLCSVLINFIYMWLVIFLFNYPSSSLQFASAGIDFAIVIRTLSVLPALYMNHKRLLRTAHPCDILVLNESTHIALIFATLSAAATFTATVLMSLGTEPFYAVSFFTEFFLGFVLSFNMFFLILDIKASSLMLDELHLLVDKKQLTMDQFVSVRQEIHSRVKESLWACDLIIVPCLASIGAILVLILFFLDNARSAEVQYETVAFITYMLKELFFVAIAFWYVAKVNARADELTIKLSRNMWGVYTIQQSVPDDGTDNARSAARVAITNINKAEEEESATACLLDTVQMIDMHRVSIHASSISEPISFTLLFKRVSWQNVAVSAAGVCTTVIIALIRSIISF